MYHIRVKKYKINPINYKPGWILIVPDPYNKYIVYVLLIKYYSELYTKGLSEFSIRIPVDSIKKYAV